MRITVLQQQTKSLQSETVTEMSKKIDSMKHLIWHGNVTEALEHLEGMLLDMDFIRNIRRPLRTTQANHSTERAIKVTVTASRRMNASWS
jgi:hypothetical protein